MPERLDIAKDLKKARAAIAEAGRRIRALPGACRPPDRVKAITALERAAREIEAAIDEIEA